jgi:mannonate dehydratase
LHDVATGDVWTTEAIAERKAIIDAAGGLTWSVVESIPVHEEIKYGGPNSAKYVDNYKTSVRNLASCGIDIVCYNFMPVVDWTRTNLEFEWGDGSKALRFDRLDFAAFDLHTLKREGAEAEYTPEQLAQVQARHDAMTKQERDQVMENVVLGMPGRMVEAYDGGLVEFRSALNNYKGLSDADVQENLNHILRQVIPGAEEVGDFMAIHPDDPPVPLFGLPRVVSTQDNLRSLLAAVPSFHNGLTVCVGSMASRPDNDIPSLVEEFADRVHFIHLRNVEKDADQTFFGSFTEADHIGGDVDMYHVMATMLKEKGRRTAEGLSSVRMPFRPDHGHRMLDDLHKKTNPGYTAIGRLRGLAELRGLEMGIIRSGVLASGK